MRFDGQVAVLTGAGRGIGAASAGRLVDEGATVVITDRDLAAAEEVCTPLGEHAVPAACDVTDAASVNRMVADVIDAHGRIDVLVACAGVTRDNLVFRMSEEDWDLVIDTHLKGSFFAVQAVQKHMVAQRSGKICLLSSASARGNRGQTNYSAAKAGLQGMARTLAIELGPFGITVNTVAPGFIETRMTRETASRLGVSFEDFRDQMASRLPVGRVGRPEDIAGVVAFLCSSDADFMTGQTLYVRGGP